MLSTKSKGTENDLNKRFPPKKSANVPVSPPCCREQGQTQEGTQEEEKHEILNDLQDVQRYMREEEGFR